MRAADLFPLRSKIRRRNAKTFFHSQKALLATLLAVSFAIAGCGGWDVPPQAKTWKNPVPSNPATLAAARQVYAYHCQKCHGIGGNGKIPPGLTYSYFTKPTNFTNAHLVDRMSDGVIFWKISHGNSPMPPFKKRLTDTQRWELVNLIRAFAHPQTASQSSRK